MLLNINQSSLCLGSLEIGRVATVPLAEAEQGQEERGPRTPLPGCHRWSSRSGVQKASSSISCWNGFFTNQDDPSFDVSSHGFLLYSALSTLGFAVFMYSRQNALIH